MLSRFIPVAPGPRGVSKEFLQSSGGFLSHSHIHTHNQRRWFPPRKASFPLTWPYHLLTAGSGDEERDLRFPCCHGAAEQRLDREAEVRFLAERSAIGHLESPAGRAPPVVGQAATLADPDIPVLHRHAPRRHPTP